MRAHETDPQAHQDLRARVESLESGGTVGEALELGDSTPPSVSITAGRPGTSSQAAREDHTHRVPVASQVQPGLVLLAGAGEGTPGRAVQGDDPRLTDQYTGAMDALAAHEAQTEAHGITAWASGLVASSDATAARLVLGLGSAALAATADFATAAQGVLADSSVQPGDSVLMLAPGGGTDGQVLSRVSGSLAWETPSGGGVEVTTVSDITSPGAALGAVAGSADGELRLVRSSGNPDIHTLYAWDSNDSSAVDSPYRVAGSSGKWIAVGGSYVNAVQGTIKLRNGSNLELSGSIISDSTGLIVMDDPINCQADQDITCEFGKWRMGFIAGEADDAYQAHYDYFNTTDYALKHAGQDGQTTVNGRIQVQLRVNGQNTASATTQGFYLGLAKRLQMGLTGVFQLGHAATAQTPTATHTLEIADSTGTIYEVLCRAKP